MIRVLHVCAGLETGGGELFLERLVQSLDAGEFDQHVVSMLGIGPVGERLRAGGVDVCALESLGKLGAIRALFKLGSHSRRIRPNVIQGWLYHGNLAAWAAQRLSRLQCPLVWNIRHSLDEWACEGLLWRSEIRFGGWVSGAADQIVFNSAHSARQHERLGYLQAKSRVIPNGFDVAKFSPSSDLRAAARRRLNLGGEDMVVGIVGRSHPLKDHGSFLRAARIVAGRERRAKFVLVGRGLDGSNETLMSLVRQLDLGDRAMLLGERDDIPDLMNAFDVYVSSSSSESLPNAVGEAMSCGVPCVVTDVGDSALLVGDTGIVVPPKSADALARGILDLIEMNRERRHALVAAARERIQLNYSMERVAQEYAALYRSVCGTAQSAKQEGA